MSARREHLENAAAKPRRPFGVSLIFVWAVLWMTGAVLFTLVAGPISRPDSMPLLFVLPLFLGALELRRLRRTSVLLLGWHFLWWLWVARLGAALPFYLMPAIALVIWLYALSLWRRGLLSGDSALERSMRLAQRTRPGQRGVERPPPLPQDAAPPEVESIAPWRRPGVWMVLVYAAVQVLMLFGIEDREALGYKLLLFAGATLLLLGLPEVSALLVGIYWIWELMNVDAATSTTSNSLLMFPQIDAVVVWYALYLAWRGVWNRETVIGRWWARWRHDE